jgi:3-hydroxyacyl-[acyl-carrier-protein] dehydratase
MSPDNPLIQALSSLPHGPEFRFVDEVTHLDPGQSASGHWQLKGSEEFLRGHFPGSPLLPGVIMIEALAQLGGILAQTRPGIAPLANLKLTAVQKFKILGSITPGDRLCITAKIEGAMGTMIQVSGSITNGEGQALALGTVMLSGES